MGRKQPVEVARLVALLQPKLDKDTFRAALLQIKGLADKIADLAAGAARRDAVHIPLTRVDSMAALPHECLLAILDRVNSTESRRISTLSCQSLQAAVRDGRSSRRWSEGVYCMAGAGAPGDDLTLEHYSQVRQRWTMGGAVPRPASPRRGRS